MTGQEIRRIRRELNKTQEEFAKIIGVSKNSVQLWETEKRNPSLTTVKLIKETYSKYSQISNSNQGGINLVKDGVVVNLREVALFVADNIEELKKEKVFYNALIIEALELLKEAQDSDGNINPVKLLAKR
ncbi:helix-turn-helix domain-containing protein [Tenacibaculum jejuense]|uniref:HTH cro/C1-type domain-containing protein n=1 Tax=Tenacibaculum jejuense TaxID=584609 RepID=A0A238U5P1_9FLAO|nr:helix-turn-helix domain-containing protein [Tenacibaculum jejuense]SNR14457.1 conserved protein of unknown function [Tenacibaculum jejuense]